MDEILYGVQKYGPPIKLLGDGSYNDFLRELFQKRFEETNKRIGDTVNDLAKPGMTKAEFFNDNVERFVEHDEIHEKGEYGYGDSKS